MPKKLYLGDFEELDEDDMSIYSKQNREHMLEDDELTPIEEAFLAGYESA